MIESVTFRYDVERYGKDVNELSKTAQFVAPVVVARRRILRTRVRFDCPWSVVGVADVDPEQVDRHKLMAWLATGGRRTPLAGGVRQSEDVTARHEGCGHRMAARPFAVRRDAGQAAGRGRRCRSAAPRHRDPAGACAPVRIPGPRR